MPRFEKKSEMATWKDSNSRSDSNLDDHANLCLMVDIN